MRKTEKKSLVYISKMLICIGSMLWILSGCGGSQTSELTEIGDVQTAEDSVQGEASDVSDSIDTSEASDAFSEEKKEGSGEDVVSDAETSGTIFVHLCGAVTTPGVYEVPASSRLYEAISRAGGLREDASDTFLNQAQILQDGSQIYVPTKEEVANGYVSEVTGASTEAGVAASSGEASETENVSSDGKVNINTADVNELMTLPGIGESKAKTIVEYRESNGNFGSIEELMNISGIKSGVFQKIKDSITI